MIRRWHLAIAGIGVTSQVIAAVWQPGYRPLVPERALPIASVAGQVMDHRGQPIAGARVCGIGDGPAIAGDDIDAARCAVSGRDGRYRIIGLLPGTYAISASDGDRIPARAGAGGIPVAQGQAATGVDIALAPGGVLVRGTVRDAAGRAIGDAQVTVEAETGAGFAITRSAGDGTFATWSAPGKIVVRASAPGFAGHRLESRAPDAAVAARLVPGSAITGRVIDHASGRPVQGALVELDDWYGGGPRPRALADEDGRFRIERLGPLWYGYDVSVQFAHRKCYLDVRVHVGLAQTVDGIDLEIRPLSGECYPLSSSEQVWVRERETAIPDRYDSVLGRGSKVIVGRVVDASGRPVVGAYVAAATDDRFGSNWNHFPPTPMANRAVLTDRAGVFVIAGVPDRWKHNLIAYRPGGGSVMVERDWLGLPDPIVIPDRARSMIAGTIFGFRYGEPEAFTIAVTDTATGIERREHFYGTGGRWAIDDLAPGAYWLAASSRDGETQEGRVRLGPGQGWTGMRLGLGPRRRD